MKYKVKNGVDNMNVLEKILKEIKDMKSKGSSSRNRDYATGYLCGLSVAEGIIRSHMDETNEDVFEFDFSNVKSFDCQCGRRYVNIISVPLKDEDVKAVSKEFLENRKETAAKYKRDDGE